MIILTNVWKFVRIVQHVYCERSTCVCDYELKEDFRKMFTSALMIHIIRYSFLITRKNRNHTTIIQNWCIITCPSTTTKRVWIETRLVWISLSEYAHLYSVPWSSTSLYTLGQESVISVGSALFMLCLSRLFTVWLPNEPLEY